MRFLKSKAEVGHGNGVYNVVTPYMNDGKNREKLKSGSLEFMELISVFWTGVQDQLR